MSQVGALNGKLVSTALAADGVVYADANGVLQTTAVGTATQVLTSNGAGVAPTFQASGSGGVTGPGSSTNNSVATWNGTTGSALFSRGTPLVDSTGRMTNSNQPCFLACLTTSPANVTGDGTIYQIPYDTVIFDQNSNFTTGASAHFTAPVTGKYLFTICTTMIFGAGSGTILEANLVCTSRTFEFITQGILAAQLSAFYVVNGSMIADMTAGDTAFTNVQQGGGAKTTQVAGSVVTNPVTFFSGYLVA